MEEWGWFQASLWPSVAIKGKAPFKTITQHYGKPAAFSYFSGCSTGGREGMILSQPKEESYPNIQCADEIANRVD